MSRWFIAYHSLTGGTHTHARTQVVGTGADGAAFTFANDAAPGGGGGGGGGGSSMTTNAALELGFGVLLVGVRAGVCMSVGCSGACVV